VLQASAYMLMMPGVPCVFYPHWVSYKSEINELIAVRKRAGIHSESKVLEEESAQNQYSATVQGHRGQVVVRVGKNRSMTAPEGFEVAVEGGDRGQYTVYIKLYPEGMEEVTGNGLPVMGEKFMEDGKLYIRVNEQVFDMLGNRVK